MFDSLKKDIMEEVFNEDLQKEVVKALNDNVDIPFLSEKTEEKMMNALYDTVEGVIKKVIMEKL
jgi:C4-type Zn-finger protein